MSRRRASNALLLVFLMMLAPSSGCFAEEEGPISEKSLDVDEEVLISGVFQDVGLSARAALSVFVPYLVRDPETGFVQNSTVVDLGKGDSLAVEILAPPRNDALVLLVGEFGRENWPIRDHNESWGTWLGRGGGGWKSRERYFQSRRQCHSGHGQPQQGIGRARISQDYHC